MYVALFLVSVLLALGVSFGIAWLSKELIAGLLNRFLARGVAAAAVKYLRFAMILVGVSSGARVRLLEDFIGAPAYNKDAMLAALTQEVWVVAMYHTVVDTLLGLAWFFILLAFLIPFTIWIIRRMDMPELLAEREQPKPLDTSTPAKTVR